MSCRVLEERVATRDSAPPPCVRPSFRSRPQGRVRRYGYNPCGMPELHVGVQKYRRHGKLVRPVPRTRRRSGWQVVTSNQERVPGSALVEAPRPVSKIKVDCPWVGFSEASSREALAPAPPPPAVPKRTGRGMTLDEWNLQLSRDGCCLDR